MLQEPHALQDWYKLINQIYLFKNYYRSVEAIYTHLNEVFGGLSLIASGKRKKGVTPEEFLPKALAWWFALCGKVGVRDIEDMLWAKFPYVCPYCHQEPHNESMCKEKKAEVGQLDWHVLKQIGEKNIDKKPRKLGDWQRMFEAIYPKTAATRLQNFSRLSEESGDVKIDSKEDCHLQVK